MAVAVTASRRWVTLAGGGRVAAAVKKGALPS